MLLDMFIDSFKQNIVIYLSYFPHHLVTCLSKYRVCIAPTPLCNGPSVNKVLFGFVSLKCHERRASVAVPRDELITLTSSFSIQHILLKTGRQIYGLISYIAQVIGDDSVSVIHKRLSL